MKQKQNIYISTFHANFKIWHWLKWHVPHTSIDKVDTIDLSKIPTVNTVCLWSGRIPPQYVYSIIWQHCSCLIDTKNKQEIEIQWGRLCICQQSWILPICILFIEIKIGTFRIASIPSGGGVGIMNSPRVTKGNFNSPWVAKPQVVRIEIDLSDKWRIHHPYPSSWRDFHCLMGSGNFNYKGLGNNPF